MPGREKAVRQQQYTGMPDRGAQPCAGVKGVGRGMYHVSWSPFVMSSWTPAKST